MKSNPLDPAIFGVELGGLLGTPTHLTFRLHSQPLDPLYELISREPELALIVKLHWFLLPARRRSADQST